MDLLKMCLFLFAVLVPAYLIRAQNTTQTPSAEVSSTLPQDTSNPPMASGSAGMFDQSIFGSLYSLPGASLFRGSREKRSPDSPADVEYVFQDFDSFGRVVSCNFTDVGLFSCSDSNTVRRCYPIIDIGSVSHCWGLFPYCNNGLCSSTPSELCASTTTSTILSTSEAG